MTGYFSGTLDFDEAAAHPGDADILTSRGTNDAYIAKYASDNSLVWVRRMGGGDIGHPRTCLHAIQQIQRSRKSPGRRANCSGRHGTKRRGMQLRIY